MKVELTPSQRKLLEYLAAEGSDLSVRGIGRHMGYSSSSTTHEILARLEDRGLITNEKNKPRARKLTILGYSAITELSKDLCPCCGSPL